MPDPLSFAVVGAGAHIAARHLGVIASLEGAELLAGCDLDSGARERVETAGARFYLDHRQMLREVTPDVVVITTPHPSHASLAIDCLRAGSHVLVEKPIATQVAEADEMVQAAESAGRLLAVNFQHRFAPLTERAKAIIDAGAVGRLVRVLCSEPWLRTAAYFRTASWRATWRGEGGGVLMNQAPHTFDLMCHLAGLPQRVWGVTATLRHPIECEDTAHALLEFEGGATGYATVSTVEAGSKRRLEIVGERGRLLIDGDALSLYRFEPNIDRHIDECSEPYGAPEVVLEVEERLNPIGNHRDVYHDLIEAVRSGRPPRVDGRAGMLSLELANAIALSAHRGSAVELPIDRASYRQLLSSLQAASVA